MEEIKLKLNEKNQGAFTIHEGNEQVAEMVIGIAGNDLTVYHTEVAQKAEGKGFAKQLLKNIVDFAREHQLKIIPLCPFVHTQFKRHPEEYADAWKKD